MKIVRPLPVHSFTHGPRVVMLSALSLALGLACSQDQVSHARVPKEAPPQAMPPGHPSTGGAPSGMSGEVPPPPTPSAEAALKWTLPKGWTEEKAGGMRFATLKPPIPGKVELSIVVLPGTAGGELANVNRWRGQIGLPPIDEAALASGRSVVKSKAGQVSVYDFTSEGSVKSRMVAGLLNGADGNTWFLKLNGDAGPVGKAKPDFMRLMESLRLD